MRKFRNTNTGEIITEEELRKEFEKLKKETPEEYDYSFGNYIRNCTDKNGTLEEVRQWVGNAMVVDSLSELPKIGERDKYRGLVISVDLYDDEDDYAIYNVGDLFQNWYFDKHTDIARWSYAIRKDNIK